MVSTTRAQSQIEISPYEAARIQLIGWGALMVTIYVIFLIVFPLFPSIHRSNHVLEIEQMLRNGRKWFAPVYLVMLGTLFYAYWRELKIVHTLSKADPEAAKSLRIWVLGIGVLSAIILVGLYPISALDVVLYVVRARLWALYGGSPMLALPADFPQDPYIRFGGEYVKQVSPYGPLWELVAQIPIRLGILDIGAGTIAMKMISLISYISMAVLIGWYARQDTPKYGVSNLTALTFFALNPMVLIQAIGNGHNDMLMLALMTLGLVLWQRGRWAWAAFALTLAALIKVTGLILLPLFGMAVLAAAPNWRTRLLRGLGIAVIFLIITGIAYRLTGPFPEVFQGAQHAVLDRWGYAPAYAALVIAQIDAPLRVGIATTIAKLTRDIFILYYVYLLIRLALGKITLAQAGFMAFFSLLLLGTTFRIWYPMWLIPFAALSLTSRTYWRTFLFSITAEVSIFMYLIVWRWLLGKWDWGLHGPLAAHWNFWIIMTLLVVPWVFGIPLLGPILRKWKDPQRFDNSLWT